VASRLVMIVAIALAACSSHSTTVESALQGPTAV
jgi:hypothetical protein